MAFHFFPQQVKAGFIGVDVFFIISGYLITSLIFQTESAGSFGFLDFYQRRIRRIFPALILMLVVLTFLASGFFVGVDLKRFHQNLSFAGLFLTNFNLAEQTAYFDQDPTTNPFLHLWSLAVEEQFYLIWPAALIIAIRKRWPVRNFAVALAVLSFAFNLWYIRQNPHANFYSLPSRFWELLVGGIMCLSQRKPQVLQKAPVDLIALAGTTLLLLAFFVLKPTDTQYPGLCALLPTIGTALLISAGPTSKIAKYVLSSKVLVWIGKISYPLYLWHWSLFSFWRIIEGSTPSLNAILAIAFIATALSIFTYLVVEQPLRWVFEKNPIRAALAAVLAVFSCTLLGSYATSANFHQGYVETQLETVENENQACRDIKGLPADLQICLFQPSAQGIDGPTVALIGDSHSQSLFQGLSKLYKKYGVGLVSLGVWACPPFANRNFHAPEGYSEVESCRAWYGQIFDFLKSKQNIKTLIFHSADNTLFRWKFDHGELNQANTRADQINGIANTINSLAEDLQRSGKRIIYFADNPWTNLGPRACLKQSWRQISLIRDCELDQGSSDPRSVDFEHLLKKDICVFDPTNLFLSGGKVKVVRNDQILFMDNDHLSIDGSVFESRAFESTNCFHDSLR